MLVHRGVDPSEALRLPGVKTYVGVDDVQGHNATGPVIFDEEIFASEKVSVKLNSVSYPSPNFSLTFRRVKEQIMLNILKNFKQHMHGLALAHKIRASLTCDNFWWRGIQSNLEMENFWKLFVTRGKSLIINI